MKLYQYTLLKEDGSMEVMEPCKEKSLKEIYEILKCNTIQQIPNSYYKGFGRCTMFGDDEARLKPHKRNPHFLVIKDPQGNEWDVVGNILMKKAYAQTKKRDQRR